VQKENTQLCTKLEDIQLTMEIASRPSPRAKERKTEQEKMLEIARAERDEALGLCREFQAEIQRLQRLELELAENGLLEQLEAENQAKLPELFPHDTKTSTSESLPVDWKRKIELLKKKSRSNSPRAREQTPTDVLSAIQDDSSENTWPTPSPVVVQL
jgi:hypothetical protein